MKSSVTTSLYTNKHEFFFLSTDNASAHLLLSVLTSLNYKAHVNSEWSNALIYTITGLTPQLNLNSHERKTKWESQLAKIANMCNCEYVACSSLHNI